MSKKRILIVIAGILLLICVGLIIFTTWQNQQTPKSETTTSQNLNGVSQNSTNDDGDQSPVDSDTSAVIIPQKRTDSELFASITSQKPSLLDSTGKPFFAIVGSVKTQNAWYVVTIKDTQDATVGNVKIILKDNGNQGGLVVIAGPGTRFDPEVIALPDEVRKLL